MLYLRLMLMLLTMGAAMLAEASTPLVVATSTDRVNVTSHFVGENLLVYGAITGPGQVIVILRSPDSTEAMQQKTRTGPIWLNGAKVTVTRAPGIWQRLSSAPVRHILPDDTLQKLGLTLSSLVDKARFDPEPDHLDTWQKAFLDEKIRYRNYVVDPAGVTLKQGLFSAKIRLPASLPLGHYQLLTYLVRQQQVVAVRKQQIDVRQVGFQAWIARFARENSWVYGIVLTFILAGLGFALGILMRRRSA